MSKLLFKNEYFKSEKMEDGSTVVTVLKDKNRFYEVDMEGCKLITNKYGFIADEFTKEAMSKIESISEDIERIETLKLELRNRTLNTLLSHL